MDTTDTSLVSRKRKKAAKSAIAIVLALLLALTGTFALAQVFLTENATNELNDKVSADAGGRLHDEFSGPDRLDASGAMDKNIYAERFVANGERNAKVWVRIQLKEYMEAKAPGGTATSIAPGPTKGNVSSWSIVNPTTKGTENASAIDGYRTLTYGNSTTGGYYMPTLNRLYSGNVTEDPYTNISADVKGALADNYAGYKSYKDYTAGATLNEGELVSETVTDGTPTVVKTNLADSPLSVEPLPATAGVRAWEDGMTKAANNWYYYDGWFYWSNELTLGDKDSVATGLLLDSVKIESEQLFGKEYYYGLDAKADFFTDTESFAKDDKGNLTLPDGKGGNKVVDQTLLGLLSQLGCMNVGGSSLPVTPSATATNIDEFKAALTNAKTANEIDATLNNIQKTYASSYDDALVHLEMPMTNTAALEDDPGTPATFSEDFYVLAKDTSANKALVMYKDLVEEWGSDGYAAIGGEYYGNTALNTWLNGEFINTYIPPDLRGEIVSSNIKYRNSRYTVGLSSMNTQMFVLSSADVGNIERFQSNVTWGHRNVDTYGQPDFYTSGMKQLVPSTLLKAKLPNDSSFKRYWTRSVAGYVDGAAQAWAIVDENGRVGLYTNTKSQDVNGVRPCFWVNLSLGPTPE